MLQPASDNGRREPCQAVLFDFDMTLADSLGAIARLLSQTAEHFGYRARPLPDMLAIAGKGYTHEAMLRLTTGETDPGRILNMRTYYRAISQELMPQLIPFFPGVPDMLHTLCEAGLQLAIVSQKMRQTLLACLERENLACCFQLVLGCEDVPAPKPDPSGLLLAARRMNLPPDRCLFTGDSLVDQQAARAAGMPFAAMLRGATTREQFDARFVRWYFDSAAPMARTLLQEFPPT